MSNPTDPQAAESKCCITVFCVTDFGAVGDGITDDTESIQAAVDAAAAAGGGIVQVPAGTFMVNARTGYTDPNQNIYHDGGGVRMRSNVHLQLDPAAVIKAFPSPVSVYKVIQFRLCQNASIRGGAIHGERNEHVGTTGEHGHAISIIGADRVSVERTTLTQAWGDGLHIAYVSADSGSGMPDRPSTDITVRDVLAEHNRRQGMSIICVDGMIVENSTFRFTGGTRPAAGIDVEPNSGHPGVQNLAIRNVRSYENDGSGLAFFGEHINNITVDDVTLARNERNRTQPVQAQLSARGKITDLTLRRVFIADSVDGAMYLSGVDRITIIGCQTDHDVTFAYGNHHSRRTTGTQIIGNRIDGTLALEELDHTLVDANTITPREGMPCIVFAGTATCIFTTIRDNKLIGGTRGVEHQNLTQLSTVRNNIFIDQDECAIDLNQGGITIEGNIFYGGSIGSSNGSFLRPMESSGSWISDAYIRFNRFQAKPYLAKNVGAERARYVFASEKIVLATTVAYNRLLPDGALPFSAFPEDQLSGGQTILAGSEGVPTRSTAYRVTNPRNGTQYFDTDLKKLLTAFELVWYDADGTPAYDATEAATRQIVANHLSRVATGRPVTRVFQPLYGPQTSRSNRFG